MKLKQLNTLTGATANQSAGDNWQNLADQLESPSQNAGQDGTDEEDETESPHLDDDRNLTTSQLADSALDNVVSCPDCSKPVLQASLADHQATCPNSKNPRDLKRKLSEDSSSQPPKKSKITLHFNSSTNNSPDASNSNSAKPSPSPVPPSMPALPTAPSTSSVPLSVSISGGPSAAGLDKKNKRVVDPDRQCGVINERGLPCQRSLTCKTHNMTAKRAVPHRSQPFDSLLMEWQKASRLGKEREALTKSLRDGTNNLGIGVVGGGAGGPGGIGSSGVGGAGGGFNSTNSSELLSTAGVGGAGGQIPLGANGYGGDEGLGGGMAGNSGKKEKKKKGLSNQNSSTTLGLSNLDPSSAGHHSLLQSNTFVPNSSATSATSKKSKKPGAGGSNSANSQTIYYVGEAPLSTNGAFSEGGMLAEEEEESDYLSSSDEVESVLLSLQKLTKRTTTNHSTSTMSSPLVMREGGGSGFSSASWWTGRNRKLMRLRGLGLESVFGGGGSGFSGSSGQTGPTTALTGVKR